MTMSTYKSLGGPPSGLILTNDAEIAKRVYDEEIDNYLADNQQAWSLDAEGRYTRIEVGEAMPHSAQQSLLARLCG